MLIVGGSSMLGQSLAAEFKARAVPCLETVRACGRSVSGAGANGKVLLNLASPPSTWPDFSDKNISVAFIFAAVTSQIKCANDPQEAYRVNVEHTVALARHLIGLGAHVVFPSTNLVYDGHQPNASANSAYSAKTLYGSLKAEAEARLLDLGGNVSIVRLPKVLSPDTPMLVNWVQALRAGQDIKAFSDLVLAPISNTLATDVFAALAQNTGGGIYQITSSDQITYVELGKILAESVGAPVSHVHATTSSDAGIALEHLPDYVTLDSERVERELGIVQPTARQTIEQVIQEQS